MGARIGIFQNYFLIQAVTMRNGEFGKQWPYSENKCQQIPPPFDYEIMLI